MAILPSERNFGVFKEPRGFIRVIQLMMTIFGFATTAGFSSSLSVDTKCISVDKVNILPIAYPFHISKSMEFKIPACNTTKEETFTPFGDYSAPSQFYVFVGVMAMLYCLAIMFVYIFMNDLYYQNDRVAKADFITSLVFAIVWFIAAVAWADGTSKLKEYTEPKRIIAQLGNRCSSGLTCSPGSSANFAGLNVSLIFGFTNCALWAAGLWFIWKETGWFERKPVGLEPDLGESGMGAETDQY